MCRTRGQSACLLVERGTQALWRHGSGFACCTFMQVSARVRISALSRIRIEAQRSGQCGERCLSYQKPTPIGAIRRLSCANLFGKLCRGACSKLTHQRFELNFRGVIPYIGEQPCAKVKERAVSKPISPCAGRQCYSDAGSRFRIAYLFQNSNVR